MPASMIPSFSKRSGKSKSEVERLWHKAKGLAADQDKPENWAYIVGILKRMLKLEGLPSFKEYMMIENILKNDTPFFAPPNFYLMEAIIDPGKVVIKTLNIEDLNNDYEFMNVGFKRGPFGGYYDKENDKIIISFENETKDEIEAILGHELVHREQHNRAGTNYFEQSKKIVDKINKLAINIQKGNKELISDYKSLLDKFRYGTPYEQMAYAYQLVKDRKRFNFSKPDDIIYYIKQYDELDNLNTNRFKKYIYMYWNIKDNI